VLDRVDVEVLLVPPPTPIMPATTFLALAICVSCSPSSLVDPPDELSSSLLESSSVEEVEEDEEEDEMKSGCRSPSPSPTNSHSPSFFWFVGMLTLDTLLSLLRNGPVADGGETAAEETCPRGSSSLRLWPPAPRLLRLVRRLRLNSSLRSSSIRCSSLLDARW